MEREPFGLIGRLKQVGAVANTLGRQPMRCRIVPRRSLSDGCLNRDRQVMQLAGRAHRCGELDGVHPPFPTPVVPIQHDRNAGVQNLRGGVPNEAVTFCGQPRVAGVVKWCSVQTKHPLIETEPYCGELLGKLLCQRGLPRSVQPRNQMNNGSHTEILQTRESLIRVVRGRRVIHVAINSFPDPVRKLLDQTAHDAGVLGVLLTGSQARPDMATPNSDVDVFVIVSSESRSRWQGFHSDALDVAVYEKTDLSSTALPRTDIDSWWQRYAFAHATLLQDKSHGEIAELVEAQATLTPAESHIIVEDFLDGYLNFAYRSLKSFRDGRALQAHLDAVESLGYALATIFALEGRIRPYNKYLPWELARYPLAEPAWDESTLLPLLQTIVASGDAPAQRELSRSVRRVARKLGHGDVIDSWGTELRIFE